MQIRLLIAAMGLIGIVGTALAAPAVTSVTSLKTDKDKLSYAIGMDLGENFKAQSIDIDPAMLANGVKDAMSGNKTALMTAEQRDQTLEKFQKEFRAKQEAELKQVAEKNKQMGDAFLAENKAKPGVITLPSGLQYKVIESGTGPLPTDKDIVAVEYEGKLINGKIFDSSAKQGKAVTFTVGDVIPGWREALKLMKAGSQWELVIPPNLAYGERGVGDAIGPNETLLFKVKLISVETPKDNKAETKNK
ncbi:MAG: FKBP-type peptidyl-prolyl cis-trans isomerase N-terminal domain-containing protein [Gammaproteobacteria bacterium]